MAFEWKKLLTSELDLQNIDAKQKKVIDSSL